MPLATNVCVVAFAHLPPAIRAGAVQVVLSDHHYWGGLRRSKLLTGICETFGLGLSMHSNSHLGISLAAMVHLAAATPNLSYACDTHWPWKNKDIVAGEPFTFRGGAIRVPGTPGLGVTLDRDALARLHEQYLRCGTATGTTPATCAASFPATSASNRAGSGRWSRSAAQGLAGGAGA